VQQKRYVLSDASAARLRDVLRQHPGDSPPRARAGGAHRQTGFVRVTGAAVGGYHPCVPEIYLRDGSTWESFTAAQVLPANGESLATGQRYFALRVGDTAAGVATWVTVGGSAGGAVVQSETISANTDDLGLDPAAGVLVLDVTGDYDLTGLDGGYPGRTVTLVNDGSGTLSLPDLTGSAAGNQFDFPSASGTTLDPGDALAFTYVGSAGSGAWVPVGTAPADAAPARTEGTLAATGSVQGDAAAITTSAVVVSGADGTKGVILPDEAAAIVTVFNDTTAQNLKVYPPSGARFGASAVNANHTLSGKQIQVFFRVSSTPWIAGVSGLGA
jgi:hypothetical protein